ncbi:sigma-54 factor interaction domain-containing protein, partial [Escherichia coli]
IHRFSAQDDAPFIAVNCAAIPEQMLESILFGHEKGAFTGAVSAQPGKFELANGGTLLLDEIGELPLGLQAKLLRVLQEQQLERVGDNRTRQVDVRVIAATNRDLRQEV